MYIHNNASKRMTQSWNKVWTIQEMVNKLPKVKNLYIELACRLWCNAVAHPFGVNCQAKMISQWVQSRNRFWDLSECIHGHWHSLDDSRSKMSTVCFPFPISHFLVPTFRVTRSEHHTRPSFSHVREGAGHETILVSCPAGNNLRKI